ncbi:hypothetical protein L2E82_37192 [Cichorium intybus]|uniref:Uncharacterized protein n=1 Tax=Cichorium intybus TaxID=13427 RepID=A0ACB9AEP5_CICIN|nr:hypothetical protein L2E82_37192 [Cichorium intybus]
MQFTNRIETVGFFIQLVRLSFESDHHPPTCIGLRAIPRSTISNFTGTEREKESADAIKRPQIRNHKIEYSGSVQSCKLRIHSNLMASIQESEGGWVSRKPRQLGGISDALSIASDLGFSVRSPPSKKLSFSNDTKCEDFVRLLRELTIVQRKVADFHVELQGRKEDMNVGHLTHVSEMEKKLETLARITRILKGVIQNKDRILARLHQPYPVDCIPVEAEYQKQFSELLMMAASDYGTLTASVSDLHWVQNFKEPPSIWADMLRPIPVALVSCTRYFEAMEAMRESFVALQKLRSGPSRSSSKYASRRTSPTESECVTPRSSENDLDLRSPEIYGVLKEEEEDEI